MAEPYLGQVCLFPYNFAPRGWAPCRGQLLSIAANTALFSLLGTTFGGDGRTTFALPDLQGRAVLGDGSGAGLTPRTLGETGGAESVTLTVSQVPAHSHALNVAATGGADATSPAGNLHTTQVDRFYSTGAPAAAMNPASIGSTGNSMPHANMQPFIVLEYCIATQGIFPSRS